MPTDEIGGYRFVPIGKPIVPGPLAFDEIDHATPNPTGSVSGVLEVTWTAKTPICIGRSAGRENGRSRVVPMTLDGEPVIPGATLKGMIRSVVEIAGFCGLGAIDGHRHYGVRDVRTKVNPRIPAADDIRAGWLSWERDSDAAEGRWMLRQSGTRGEFFLLSFDELALAAGMPVTSWRKRDVFCKYYPLFGRDMTWCERISVRKILDSGRVDGGNLGYAQRVNSGGTTVGYLVVTGPASDDSTKANEHVFLPPSHRDKGTEIDPALIRLFSQMHSSPGRDRPKPRDAWLFWLRQMGYDDAFDTSAEDVQVIPGYEPPGIPVFFFGFPAHAAAGKGIDAANCGFFFGLSRVIRIPYLDSVGVVAARTMAGEAGGGPPSANAARSAEKELTNRAAYEVPGLSAVGDSLDIARAVFGDLDQVVVPPDADGENRRKLRSEARALASRVRFESAFATGPANETDPIDVVFGAPRPSFYPAYLAQPDGGASVTYDTPNAKLAGRKRYPVRSIPNPKIVGAATNGGTEASLDTQTRISFLEAGTVFRSRIRFRNLHPVELGALLWGLTFGRPGEPYRHASGRGKAFGYGALEVGVQFGRRPVTRNLPDEIGGAPEKVETYLDAFEAYMETETKRKSAFDEWPEISRLRAMADPEIGQLYRANLAYPDIEAFKTLKTGGLGHVRERWDDTNR